MSDRLSDYIDEQLNHKDRLRVETHLSACAHCRADLHSLRWTLGLMQQAPAVKIPRSFVLREVDVTPRLAPAARLRLITVQWATAAVALLFVLVLGIDLLGGAAMRGATQQEAAMLAATAPQAAEERVAETIETEKEQVAPEADVPPLAEDSATDTPTAGAGEPDLSAMPTPTEPAAKMMGPREGRDETPTPLPTEETMLAAVPEETPAPTEESLTLQAPEPTPEPRAGDRNAEATVPPDKEQTMMQVQEYDAQPERDGGRIAWWIAEAVLGFALLILIGTLIWLRQRA